MLMESETGTKEVLHSLMCGIIKGKKGIIESGSRTEQGNGVILIKRHKFLVRQDEEVLEIY